MPLRNCTDGSLDVALRFDFVAGIGSPGGGRHYPLLPITWVRTYYGRLSGHGGMIA